MPRVTITVPDHVPQPYRFSLGRESVTLGRAEDNDVPLDCPSISLHHAIMERIPGGFQLRDLGSTNGIKLGGAIQAVISLADGMTAQIGDVDFSFTLNPEEQATLEQEAYEQAQAAQAVESPAPMAAAAAAPVTAAPQPAAQDEGNPVVTSLGWLVFLVFALGSFGLGVSIRYSEENPGQVFLKDLKSTFADEPVPEDSP